MTINIVVTVDRYNGISESGTIPCIEKIDAINKWFFRLVAGNYVIMSKEKWEQRGKVLVPDAKNIILTADKKLVVPDAVMAFQTRSITELSDAYNCFIIGGSEVFRTCFSKVEKIYMAVIEEDLYCDVTFPEDDLSFWKEVRRIPIPKGESTPFNLQLITYERVPK